MITLEKLKIYIKYNGNIERWAQNDLQTESKISDDDWFRIDMLIQNIELLRKQLASKEFSTVLYNQLKSDCQDSATIKHLLLYVLEKNESA